MRKKMGEHRSYFPKGFQIAQDAASGKIQRRRKVSRNMYSFLSIISSNISLTFCVIRTILSVDFLLCFRGKPLHEGGMYVEPQSEQKGGFETPGTLHDGGRAVFHALWCI